MSEHTPGPWRIEKCLCCTDWYIEPVGPHIQGDGVKFEDANLIAAAPDLLEALEDIDRYFRSGNPVPVERATIKADSDAVRRMKTAIAKARGEQ